MKKIVIFDLDGTLLNTIADLATATNQALQHFGYPTHSIEAYRFFVGNGINKLFERALPETERTEANVLRIRSQFIPYYNVHNADFSTPSPGIPEVLHTLQSHGILLAVASNKFQAGTEKLIKKFFPEIDWVEICGNREGVPLKPDTALVDMILDKAGVERKGCVMIGDSGVDIQTAHNAGITSVGVSWGFRSRSELKENGADYIADDATELLHILENI